MKKTLFALSFFAAFSQVMAQEEEDLLKELEKQDTVKSYVSATFKGTRLISLPTTEILGKKTLEFRIAHRFGDMATESTGANTLYGLDGPVAMYLTFDYSLTDRLSLGVGRTNIGKLIDGNVKYQILKQHKKGGIPVTLTYFGKANISTEKYLDNRFDDFANRMSYVNQLMVARKFNSKLSLQLNLIHIHHNLVRLRSDDNTMFATAFSGRYKVTKRVAVTAEYAYRIGDYITPADLFHDHLAVGVDIETGGHVFQLFVSNSFTVNEAQLVPYNDRNWADGQFRFGFNVSRAFSL